MSQITKGGFDYEIVRRMPFDEYEILRKECQMLNDKLKREINSIDGKTRIE